LNFLTYDHYFPGSFQAVENRRIRVYTKTEKGDIYFICAQNPILFSPRLNITSRNLYLVSRGRNGAPLYLRLSSDGQVHNNLNNDPFYPMNLQWMVWSRPKKPESDSHPRPRAGPH